jgi:hypothetical protein
MSSVTIRDLAHAVIETFQRTPAALPVASSRSASRRQPDGGTFSRRLNSRDVPSSDRTHDLRDDGARSPWFGAMR